MTTKEAIEILERRSDYLASRVAMRAALNDKEREMHRDRAELGALKLAIKELEIRWKLRAQQ